MRLAAVCQRAGVDRATANVALLRAAPWPERGPWATEVEVCGERLVVGQGDDPRFFLVFPLPFSGHADEWKVVPPLATAADLLAALRR